MILVATSDVNDRSNNDPKNPRCVREPRSVIRNPSAAGGSGRGTEAPSRPFIITRSRIVIPRSPTTSLASECHDVTIPGRAPARPPDEHGVLRSPLVMASSRAPERQPRPIACAPVASRDGSVRALCMKANTFTVTLIQSV